MLLSTRTIGIGLCLVSLGIALGFLLPGFSSALYILIAGGVAALFIGGATKQKTYLLVSVGVCLVALGMIRVAWVDDVRTEEADKLLDTKTEILGVVARDPDRRASSVQYVFEVESFAGQPLQRPVFMLANLPRYPEYAVGDELVLSGTLALPKDFETDPSRPPFPYVKYLAKDGIGYTMSFPSVMEARATGRFPVTRMLSGWKRAILEKGNQIFPEPEGGLLVGMILGERHALPSDILDQMRIAGLVHIIVVSGYNMTVVAEGASKLFRFLPVFARSSVGFLVIWIYAGMVGGGAPVIRAAIMTSFALLARVTKNTALALRLLSFSAVIMVIHNPRIVLDDASFHLSFLATLGLIVLSGKIAAYLPHQGKEKTLPWWKELLSATLAAQLMVIPYILFFSGQLSPYALPANLLALPAVPLAMGLGALALFIGAVIPWAGPFLGALAFIPAWWVIAVGNWFAKLPGSGAVVPIPLWGALGLYALGFFFLRRFRKRDVVDVSEK